MKINQESAAVSSRLQVAGALTGEPTGAENLV